MAYYSDFWLAGGVLSLAWANRLGLPELDSPEDAAESLDNLDMPLPSKQRRANEP